ncbi:hypothetical protein [Bacillus sp. AFS055030]|nr:hypothetical protein [Bacillus sp. AFS055030]
MNLLKSILIVHIQTTLKTHSTLSKYKEYSIIGQLGYSSPDLSTFY